MEFDSLIADFAEATGAGLETDSHGTAYCEADGVSVTVQYRSQRRDVVLFTFPCGEMPVDETMMRHALELSMAGLGTDGFFIGLCEGALTLSAVLPLEGLDAEKLGKRMLDLAAATRRVAERIGNAVADACVDLYGAGENLEDDCNQNALRV